MNTQQSSPAKLIACAESYLYPSLPIAPFPSEAASPALHIIPSQIVTKLKNLGPTRAKDMRSLNQVRQIVSHVPIAASPASCTKFNDSLFAALQLNADKVSALALLPCGTGDGKVAAKELQRCVGKMRFVGGMLSMGKNGAKELCGESYEELWTAAERFQVPIMLRTMWPSSNELAAYRVSPTDITFASLAIHLHTTQNDSPLCILHLYLSGVFDRHPRLHVVLSNPGLLPSLLPRVEHILSSFAPINKPKRSFLDVWKSNIFVTTADVLNMSAIRTLLEQIPIDRVLYATNYPFEERGKELMDALRRINFLSTGDFELVAWKNAENVFNLRNSSSVKGRNIMRI